MLGKVGRAEGAAAVLTLHACGEAAVLPTTVGVAVDLAARRRERGPSGAAAARRLGSQVGRRVAKPRLVGRAGRLFAGRRKQGASLGSGRDRRARRRRHGRRREQRPRDVDLEGGLGGRRGPATDEHEDRREGNHPHFGRPRTAVSASSAWRVTASCEWKTCRTVPPRSITYVERPSRKPSVLGTP
jgi:hypothetical protein